jgi:small-conductance mechanosensitive channel
MDYLTDPNVWQNSLQSVLDWLATDVLVLANLVQLLVIAVLFSFAWLIAPRLRRFLDQQLGRDSLGRISSVIFKNISTLAIPGTWLVLQWLVYLVADHAAQPSDLLRITVSLLTAWIIIRLTSALVRDPGWAKSIAIVAWSIAALSILGLLDDTVDFLDSLAITAGGLRISALLVIKGMLSLAVLLWAALVTSRVFERRITQSSRLTPTLQVLIVKLLKIVLVSIAVVVALSAVGIDLTAFAVLGGAIGVGIGFGLQKIVSNLISGVIILLDKSIKPGDVVSVGDTFGWINSLGARYASVVTRDGTEWLIPNEDLITQQVVNWSYSNNEVRLKIPIGISYKSDPRKAVALCFEAAAEEQRILNDPKTNVLVKGFGDNSVDIEMRIWIRDPQNGVSNIKSAVLLRVWDKFHEHGIEIPFPQRDLHLIPPADVNVWMKGPEDDVDQRSFVSPKDGTTVASQAGAY